MLRGELVDVLAVAIARGESLGYAETDDSWRKALAALKEMKL